MATTPPRPGLFATFAAAFGLLSATVPLPAQTRTPSDGWLQIMEKIRADFPGVPEISTADLAAALSRPSPPILIDCRAQEEFAVSHLPGALHATSVDEVKKIAAPENGIIVYCSVGYRSAKLVAALRAAGFSHTRNLNGSIFAWANEHRPLVRPGGEKATTVHPFSPRWAQLLESSKRHPIP